MAGSFSLKFGSFSPITRPSYPHIKDKMTEIARNSPILRSDYLRELQTISRIQGYRTLPTSKLAMEIKAPQTALKASVVLQYKNNGSRKG